MTIGKLSLVLIVFTSLVLSGCSSKPAKFKSQEERYNDSPIPRSEKTMQEIYDNRGSAKNETQGHGMPGSYAGYMVNKRRVTDDEVAVAPYTGNIYTTPQFRKLPNPTIYVYMLPSLTQQDRMPRPGWWTEFNLYDKDEYALPGEVSLTEGY